MLKRMVVKHDWLGGCLDLVLEIYHTISSTTHAKLKLPLMHILNCCPVIVRRDGLEWQHMFPHDIVDLSLLDQCHRRHDDHFYSKHPTLDH